MSTTPLPSVEDKIQAEPTWRKYFGTIPQWISAIVVTLVAIGGLIAYLRTSSETAFKSQVNEIVGAQLKPLGDKLDDIKSRVATLEGWRQGVESNVKTLKESQLKLQTNQNELSKRLQADLNPKQPKQSLEVHQPKEPPMTVNPEPPTHVSEDIGSARIAEELSRAIEHSETLPKLTVARFYEQLRVEPQEGIEYWKAVAALINYQSGLNQKEGIAPDPALISRPCNLLKGALQDHVSFYQCVVDIDGANLTSALFQNSVVRYHGGDVFLSEVAFINCRFVIDLPKETIPSPQLLTALLKSDDQKAVKLTR
jgi:hypothetical protein